MKNQCKSRCMCVFFLLNLFFSFLFFSFSVCIWFEIKWKLWNSFFFHSDVYCAAVSVGLRFVCLISFTMQHLRITTFYRFVSVGFFFFLCRFPYHLVRIGFLNSHIQFVDSKICVCVCLFGLEFNKRISNSYNSNMITPRVYLIFVL